MINAIQYNVNAQNKNDSFSLINYECTKGAHTTQNKFAAN